MSSNKKEPLALKAGDNRVLVNGKPMKVDFRILAESYYQNMIEQSNQVEIKSFLIGASVGFFLSILITTLTFLINNIL